MTLHDKLEQTGDGQWIVRDLIEKSMRVLEAYVKRDSAILVLPGLIVDKNHPDQPKINIERGVPLYSYAVQAGEFIEEMFKSLEMSDYKKETVEKYCKLRERCDEIHDEETQ